MEASLSPAVKYFSKRSKRRSSAKEALKPLKELFLVLEERLQNLETSLTQTRENLGELRNPWDRLSRPRCRLYGAMSQERKGTQQGRPEFNRFVRARHTGASPFRPNINLPAVPGTRSGSQKVLRVPNEGKENRSTRDATNAKKRVAKKPVTPMYAYLPEPENGPTFHRNHLEEETARLLASADQWESVKISTPDLNDEIIGEIDCVVNGIRLLVSSKFKQFRGLVENCAKNYRVRSRIPVANQRGRNCSNAKLSSTPANPAVLPEDLDGFWSVIALQVDNLKNRSEKLEALKKNGWVQIYNPPVSTRPPRAKQVKISKKAPAPANNGRSRFREFLLKKKEDKDVGQSANAEVTTPKGPKETPGPVIVPRLSVMPDLIPTSLNESDLPQQLTVITDSSPTSAQDQDSLPPLENRHARPPRSSMSMSLTPRVIHNIEKARNSRRFSTGIILQQSLIGRYAPELQSPIGSSYSSATSSPSSSLNIFE